MLPPKDLIRICSAVTAALEVLVLIKSLWISRGEPLRSFAVLMSVVVVTDFAGFVVPYHTNLYYYIFAGSESARIALSFWVILTIYQTIFRQYPGIAGLSNWVIKIGFVAAALVGIATGSGLGAGSPDSYLKHLFRVETFVSSTFVVFLILIQIFLLYFPIRLNRNTIVHTFAFGFLFFCYTLAFFNLAVARGHSELIALYLQVATAIVYSMWLFGLSRAGELDTHTTGTGWSSEREHELQRQLDSLENLIVATSKGGTDRNLSQPKREPRVDRTNDI